jgi:hypothetical protein
MEVVGSVKRTGLTLADTAQVVQEQTDKKIRKIKKKTTTQKGKKEEHAQSHVQHIQDRTAKVNVVIIIHPHFSLSHSFWLYRVHRDFLPPGAARQLKGQKRMSNGTERDLARNADAP